MPHAVIIGYLIGYSKLEFMHYSYVDNMCFVSLSFRAVREYLSRAMSLISGLFILSFLFLFQSVFTYKMSMTIFNLKNVNVICKTHWMRLSHKVELLEVEL